MQITLPTTVLGWLGAIVGLAALVLIIWRLIEAIKEEEWLWVVIILLFPVLGALLHWAMD